MTSRRAAWASEAMLLARNLMSHCKIRPIVLAAAAAVSCCGSLALAQDIGPSTLQTPYVIPTAPGVRTISFISNGNGTGGQADETYARTGGGAPYRMAGIPDGAGAYSNGDGTFTFLMTHELGATAGVVRAHGTAGSFVSKWIINADANNLAVRSGEDLIKTNAPVAGGAAPFGRFCSADLPAVSAFRNTATGLGTDARIFMSGEEVGSEGRLYGMPVTGANAGTSYFLPALGKFSWENALANPFMQDKTIVISTDDSTPGEVYMYVGTKTNSANPIDAAGLNNGTLYGMKTPVFSDTTATPAIGATTFVPFNTATQTGLGSGLQTASAAAGVTQFARPEDGAWDVANPTDFYFVTTGTSAAPDRLYRTRLNDIANPETGANTELLLDSALTESMDNITVVNGRDGKTRVLMQEDPGSSSRLAKIWMFTPDTGELLEVAAHDAKFFSGTAATNSTFLTTNEESSGIIPVWDILGDGWFLADVQAHYGSTGELVEGGQAFAIFIPQSVPEPTTIAALAASSMLALRRRRAR